MARFDLLLAHSNFEDHQAAAGRRVVTTQEADEVFYSTDRKFIRNRHSARGQYLMLGLTASGRDITVVLLATEDATEWLAYTAWDT